MDRDPAGGIFLSVLAREKVENCRDRAGKTKNYVPGTGPGISRDPGQPLILYALAEISDWLSAE